MRTKPPPPAPPKRTATMEVHLECTNDVNHTTVVRALRDAFGDRVRVRKTIHRANDVVEPDLISMATRRAGGAR